MYKQLLLRPSAIAYHDGLEEERAEQEAFSHLCSPLPDESSEYFSPSTAFSVNWMRHLREMEGDAAEGERRFLDRLEYPSLWETEEINASLHGAWLERDHVGEVDPDHCPDKGKERATVKQYAAIVGLQVAKNLEGLARARLEKRPRQYQSDAAVHQAYLRMTTGGDGADDCEGVDDAADDPPAAPQLKIGAFEELPRLGMTSSEDLTKALTYGHRIRPNAFVKELLALPCMDWKDVLPDCSSAGRLFDQGRGEAWRLQYRGLRESMSDVWSGTDHLTKQLHMLELQDHAFQDKHADEDESDDEDEAPAAGDPS